MLKQKFFYTFSFYKQNDLKDMSGSKQRYVFIDFDNLKNIKFNKLEKVCDKLFILIDEKEKKIPFKLVREVQRLGRNVKWVSAVANDKGNFDLQLAFLLGRMHQKAHKDIEFAILTNDTSFDDLVEFVNINGRACIRIKRKKTKREKRVVEQLEHKETVLPTLELKHISDTNNESYELIAHAASETIERLIQSGNRPAQVEVLKDYILMYHKDELITKNVDAVLEEIANRNEIKIEQNEVLYNF